MFPGRSREKPREEGRDQGGLILEGWRYGRRWRKERESFGRIGHGVRVLGTP